MAEKRYVVSLQDIKDKCCYKDFFETNTLKEAEEQLEERTTKMQRSCIIFDRYMHQIVNRKIIGEKPVVVQKKVVKKKKKGQDDKDSYFE